MKTYQYQQTENLINLSMMVLIKSSF